jgi:hypothetical protein
MLISGSASIRTLLGGKDYAGRISVSLSGTGVRVEAAQRDGAKNDDLKTSELILAEPRDKLKQMSRQSNIGI